MSKFEGLRGKFPGFWILISLILLLLVISSSIYRIDVDEVGVIQRFGKHVRTSLPGLNFKLPWGIEKLTKVKVRHVYQEEFGLRTNRDSALWKRKDGDEV